VANDLLKEGKQIKIEARGYSMYPTIKQGNTVYIEAYSKLEEVLVGDVIAWKKGSNIILHRVINIYGSGNNTFFETRGDGSLNTDPPLTYDKILGKAVLVETGKRSWSLVSGTLLPEWKYWLNKRMVWLKLKFNKLIKMLKNG
jgi:signal peptidase I